VARRGELVGDAYIRITADTTPMRRALKREAALAEKDGAVAGKAYSSAFGKEVEAAADTELKDARDAIRKSLIKGLVTGNFDEWKDSFGSVEEATKRLRLELERLRSEDKKSAAEWQVFQNAIEKWSKSALVTERAEKDAEALEKVRQATIKARDEFEKIDKAHFQAIQEDARRLRVEIEKAHAEAIKFDKAFEASVFDEHLRDAALEAARFNNEIRKTGRIRFGGRGFEEAQVSIEKLRQGLRGADALIFKSRRDSDSLSGGLRRAERAGKSLGTVFGGISKSLEGMAHRGNPLVDIFVAPLRAAAGLGSFVEKSLGAAFARMGLTGAAGSMASFGAAAAAAAVAVIAAVKGASLLAGALSLVAGMATLAASALGGAVVGALLQVASAAPAALAGLGAVILFFKDFSKQAPKATAAAKKFGTDFQKAFDKTAFKGVDAAVTNLFKVLTPMAVKLAGALGTAMSQITVGFAKALTQPAVLKNLKFLTEIVPGQVLILGKIFTNLTTAIIGFFAALAPFATTFLKSIEAMTKKFSDFVNSAKGKESLTEFFDTTTTMAKSLWQTLVNIADAIGSVFKAASGGAAQKFLGALEQLTGKFAAFLKSTEGQNKLKKWFDEAWRAMQAVGTLLQGIGAIFGALNTEKSREQVIKITDSIGNFLVRVAPALSQLVGWIDGIGDSLSKKDWSGFTRLFDTLAGSIGRIGAALGPDITAAFEAKLGNLESLAKTIGDDLVPALEAAQPWLEALINFIASSALTGAATAWKGVSDVISGLVTTLSGLLNVLTGIVTLNWDKVTEGIGQLAEGLLKSLSGSGNIATGSGIGGMVQKWLGFDTLNFDQQKKQVEDFFDTTKQTAADGTSGPNPIVAWLDGGLGRWFTDTRLTIGKWFDDAFSAPEIDFSAVGDKITSALTTAKDAVVQWAKDVSKSVEDALNTVVDNIGKFFTETIPEKFSEAATAIGEFFTQLPGKLAYIGGAIAGSIVEFFVANFLFLQSLITDTIIPFFAALPENIVNAITAAGNWIQEWWMNAYNGALAWWDETVVPWFASLKDNIVTWLGDAFNWIKDWFSTAWNNMITWWTETVIPWFKGLPSMIADAIRAAGNWIQEWWMTAYNNAIKWWTDTVWPWIKSLPNQAKEFVLGNITWLKDWFVSSWNSVVNWWNTVAQPWLAGLPATIQTAFVRLAINIGHGIAEHMKGVINNIIANINEFIRGFNDFSPFDLPFLRYLARGGMVYGPTRAVIGEAGPEAVVPLNRPLSQVDPSVRWLSAMAQNKTSSFARGGVAGTPGNVNIAPGAITLLSPFSDPEIVAQSLLDRIAVNGSTLSVPAA